MAHIIKPTVAGDTNGWGTILNTAIDAIHGELAANATAAAAALPKTGGTLTGPIVVKTASMVRVDKGSVAGAIVFDLTTGDAFTVTPTGASTWSFTNTPAGALATGWMIKVTNGGANTITFPPAVKWNGGTPPALTVAGVDTLVFITDDNGVTVRAAVLMLDSK